eukprot:gnl/TRDRNA2_/TRDRNA2_154676_c0_seq4.p1 gnl/TRDRNA2_/TRDRNA2_154676_c0~~gnl/TRDRNA2_/TRDRNA2_154676_c0_seq4.p1  ORF type:complete len:135 (+),score=17.48 gnl/TRDRNA2_/TRDRNA2_154676_c0_seq4:230-634(+)
MRKNSSRLLMARVCTATRNKMTIATQRAHVDRAGICVCISKGRAKEGLEGTSPILQICGGLLVAVGVFFCCFCFASGATNCAFRAQDDADYRHSLKFKTVRLSMCFSSLAILVGGVLLVIGLSSDTVGYYKQCS